MHGGGPGRGAPASGCARAQYVLLGAALGFVAGHALGGGLIGGGLLERRGLRERIRQLEEEHEARDSEAAHMRQNIQRLRNGGAKLRQEAAEAEQAKQEGEHALSELAHHAAHAEQVGDLALARHGAEGHSPHADGAEGRSEGGAALVGEDDAESAPYEVRGLELPLRRAENSTIIVIPVNLGYLAFGLNLVCSLRALGVRHYALLAMDNDVLQQLQQRRLPVFVDPDLPFVSSKAAQWADPNFHKLVCTKLVTVTNLLRKGVNVILTDADIVWRRTPWEHMRWDLSLTFSIGSCHRELPDNKDLSKDRVAKLNTGFYFARAQAPVIDLFSRAYQICKRGTLMGDQPAINTAIHQDMTAGRPKYTYGFFDGCLFANGCVFFKHLCANTSRSDPVLVHANYVVGRKRKIRSLAKHGLWNENCVGDLGGDPLPAPKG
eukprot:TRINITY_DN29444_c0_g1_i1.p1 TRINITY_DN29444_c0_g1~~TRINITY_DN29444_c0_g1_i1.p1  ORF type:complete len:462 (+),score=139.10 TRINITY_DN29444_c0_g1_i1:82-1386(+)